MVSKYCPACVYVIKQAFHDQETSSILKISISYNLKSINIKKDEWVNWDVPTPAECPPINTLFECGFQNGPNGSSLLFPLSAVGIASDFTSNEDGVDAQEYDPEMNDDDPFLKMVVSDFKEESPGTHLPPDTPVITSSTSSTNQPPNSSPLQTSQHSDHEDSRITSSFS